MFSCALIQASDKAEDGNPAGDVLVAESVNLDLQVVSNAGRGVAECRYHLDKKCEDVVVCVPSSVSVRGASSQLVKVTKCCMEVLQRDGTHPPHSTNLCLSKLDADYSNHAKGLPSFQAIKKSLKRSVAPEDLILNLGHFEAGTTVVLKFEFLLQLRLSQTASAASKYQHIIENGIPSKCVSYELRHASHVPVVGVSPSSSSTPLTNFKWVHTDRTKQVIQVSFTARPELGKKGRKSAVFSIEMAADRSQSACCNCLVQTNSRQPGSPLEGKYDGVMMLSSRLTRDQIASNGGGERSSKHLYPSEFVFVVDCSASMNLFIDSVIATLITSIKSLPQGCYFNVIAFGSTFRQLFHESKEYTNSSMKNAVDFANQLKAGLGGTELLPPLKWVYKTRKHDMPCEIFIITDMDQEVKDIPYTISTIKKHRHHARCHTFGIGSSICESLVTSIAEVSGGRSVILPVGDRLQTKVMEVLKQTLDPYLMDAKIRWQPPEGYCIVESTSKSLGTVFCHQTHLAFAFLKKTSRTMLSSKGNAGAPHPPATIVGSLEGAEVEIPIAKAMLPPLSPPQTSELASILARVGQWTKLEEMEIARLLSVSRKNSMEDEEEGNDQAPKAKRPRLNGEVSNGTVMPLPSEIQNELLQLSLDSGIPCPFTFLHGTASDGREVVQALPFKRPNHKGKNGVISHSIRKRQHKRYRPPSANTEPQNILKSTISAVSSSLMNLMNLFSPPTDPSLLLEGGNTIDDEVELQKRRKTQLFWDESKGEIKYPPMYYQESGSGKAAQISTNHHNHRTSKQLSRTRPNSTRNGRCLGVGVEPMDVTARQSSRRPTLDTSSSSDDEEDVTISDSESDSSVELDWESLPKTREYLPLIQMQLFSGAWPMVHEFSYAVRVPLGEIDKLPLLNRQPRPNTAGKKAAPPRPVASAQRNCCSQESDEESAAHFWTTALAVVCFRECFPQFEEEWELIVRKGEAWLQQNLKHQCGLSWPEVQANAKELLFRKA